MVIIEQLVYGIDPSESTLARSVLAVSPGMGGEVSAEIQRFCDGWGQAPALGLQHPALLSFPLESTMPAMRGRLYAVIRMEKGESPLFHAAVLSEQGYAAFEYNPYALAGAGVFEEGYVGGSSLPRREIQPGGSFDPARTKVSAEDVGLIDEAVQWLLAGETLELPIEQPRGESDRALALILAALPTALRKNQRFASFSTSDYNGYSLAAKETEGSSFSSWKRWFMAQPNAQLDDGRIAYVRKVRDRLAKGSLDGLSDADYMPGAETRGASLDIAPTAAPARPAGGSPILPAGGGQRTAGPASRNNAYRPVTAAAHRSAVSRSAVSRSAVARSTPDPAPERSFVRPRSVGRPRLVSSPVRIRQVGNRRLPVPVAMTVVLAVASLAAYLWLSHGGQDGGFGWAVLKDRFARGDEPRSTSLLEVVNVGHIYEKHVKRVTRSGLAGVGEAGSRGRGEVLAQLQVEAAAPLLQQAETYLEVAADGIQQGNRPDREIRRLESLVGQGEVIEQEISRLEMSWYSLASGADWRDLGDLSDTKVAARRDSLIAASPHALDVARRELGTLAVRKRLGRVNEQMEGMQDLLTLFQADRWSQDWERRLYRAAEKVSPSATGTTRAYRNAAFVLVRLKKAERAAAHRELPFTPEFAQATWPSPQVRDILPSLRRQVQKFRAGEAPALLDGIATLYAYLGRPRDLAGEMIVAPEALRKLEDNPAYRFDPDAYADYLSRIRFEAADSLLVQQTDEQLLPDGYFIDRSRTADNLFRAALAEPDDPRRWEELAAADGPAFFARWAVKQADRARETVAGRRNDFDAGYVECVRLLARLREQATGGGDWTITWGQLSAKVDAGLGPFGPAALDDLVRTGRRERLQALRTALDAGRPLRLTGVTVRLDQAAASEPLEAVVRLTVEPDGKVLVSQPIPLGPAAPAGSGWVGTGAIEWTPAVGAGSVCRAEVFAAGSDEPLLQAGWDSLADGAGPGALGRLAEGDAGSVRFRISESWWSDLDLPDLE